MAPRPPFCGDAKALLHRLTEEIEELRTMKENGYKVTADDQNIDYLISLRRNCARQIEQLLAAGRHGRW